MIARSGLANTAAKMSSSKPSTNRKHRRVDQPEWQPPKHLFFGSVNQSIKTRRPEAKQIAKKLQLTSIKNENRCVACHYTQQHAAAEDLRVIAGVSCESCHGAGKDWNNLHHDYGGEGLTWKDESPEHRTHRITASISAGMRNPVNVYLVAQSCFRCHTTADEELVNIGSHSAGSLHFEFASWSQGTIRHNFALSGGKTNQVRSQEKPRLMLVAGMIAELEAALHGTAIATEKATYGVTGAQRAARAAARLKTMSQKVQSPTIEQILLVFGGVSLKLNNEQQLVAAANEIAALGYQFAKHPSSEDLSHWTHSFQNQIAISSRHLPQSCSDKASGVTANRS